MKTLTAIGVILALLTTLFYNLDSHLEKFYIFHPTALHTLAQSAIAEHGNDTAAMVQYIAQDLNAKYPKHINMEEVWMFNNHGGAMGAMWILHASITEYVIIYGE